MKNRLMQAIEVRDQETVCKEILSINYKEKNWADEMAQSDKALAA